MQATDNAPHDRRFAPQTMKSKIIDQIISETPESVNNAVDAWVDSLPKPELPIPLNNYVLLRAKNDNTKIQFKDGTILFLDTSYQVGQHTPVVCEVMAVCDRLYYDPYKPGSMPWKTTIEVQKGDIVYIDYISYQNSFDEDTPRWIEHEGEQLFFVPYFSLFVAKRRWDAVRESIFWIENSKVFYKEACQMGIALNGKQIYDIICLNGFCLIEAVEKEIKTSLILPDYLKKQKNADTGILRYKGKPIEEYEESVYQAAGNCESGSLVIMDKNCNVPLEYDTHLTFFDDHTYFRVQDCFLFGIFSQES